MQNRAKAWRNKERTCTLWAQSKTGKLNNTQSRGISTPLKKWLQSFPLLWLQLISFQTSTNFSRNAGELWCQDHSYNCSFSLSRGCSDLPGSKQKLDRAASPTDSSVSSHWGKIYNPEITGQTCSGLYLSLSPFHKHFLQRKLTAWYTKQQHKQ